MTDNVIPVHHSRNSAERAATIFLWIAQLAVAGILGMGAFTKLFDHTSSMVLADALGVGRAVVMLIGLAELAAATLVLMPRRHTLGALLAIATMVGALFTHATRIGWSGSSPAEMWPMALVVLAASVSIVVLRYRRS